MGNACAMEQREGSVATATRHRIEIKLTAEQKDLIVRGAAAARQDISEFVRAAAENAARRALGES